MANNKINTLIQGEGIDAIVWKSNNGESTNLKKLVYSPSSVKSANVVVYDLEDDTSGQMFFIDPAMQDIVDGLLGAPTTKRLWVNLVSSSSGRQRLAYALGNAQDWQFEYLYKKLKTTEDLVKGGFSWIRGIVIDWSGFTGILDELILPTKALMRIQFPTKLRALTAYIGVGFIDHMDYWDQNYGLSSTTIECNSISFSNQLPQADSSGNITGYIYETPYIGQFFVNQGGTISLLDLEADIEDINIWDETQQQSVPGQRIRGYNHTVDADPTPILRKIVNDQYSRGLTIRVPQATYNALNNSSITANTTGHRDDAYGMLTGFVFRIKDVAVWDELNLNDEAVIAKINSKVTIAPLLGTERRYVAEAYMGDYDQNEADVD